MATSLIEGPARRRRAAVPSRLFVADALNCSLSSYRAKPAGNSNDTGGAEESDLEKMKQVNVSTALARG